MAATARLSATLMGSAFEPTTLIGRLESGPDRCRGRGRRPGGSPPVWGAPFLSADHAVAGRLVGADRDRSRICTTH